MTNLATDAISVPGLEHKHAWSRAGFVLGDNQGPLPRFRVTDIDGIHSLPDLVTDNNPLLAGAGEYPRPGRILGRTVTYTGLLQARTLGELRYQAGLFRGAAVGGLTLPEGVMTLTPVAAGLSAYHYKARCVQAEMPDTQAVGLGAMPTPWQRSFVIAFRLSDPRLYLEPQVVVASAAAAGNNNPFVDVTNGGTAPSPPVVRVNGPVVNPVIVRDPASSVKLYLNGTLAAGQWVDIDFAAKKITRDNGDDWTSARDIGASNWWDAGVEGVPGGTPGPTTTRFYLWGRSNFPGAGASIRVSFYPAMW